MKKQIAAFAAALTLAGSLSGCTFGTPESVGSIGDSNISSGLYLFMQYNAYKAAAALTEDTDVLKASLTLEDGTTQNGADYIAAETEKSMNYYAAVESRFAEMGGEFTEQDEATAKAQYQSLWETFGADFTANGIGEKSVMDYMRNMVKATRLVEMTYGPEGTEPVADEDVWAYVDENFTLGDYISFYLIDYSTYGTLEDDKIAEVRKSAQAICDDVKGGTDIMESAKEHMPAACEAMGLEYTEDLLSSVVGSLYATPSTAKNYGEAIGEQLLQVRNGECKVIEDGMTLMVYCSAAVEDVYELDTIRTTALVEMQGKEFDQALRDQGAGLAHKINAAALKKLPASKIKA